MPPSPTIGTSCSWATAAHIMIAVSCGTPTPATMRVVQMLPGPMPTFTPSAPALMSAAVPSGVATFPATTPDAGGAEPPGPDATLPAVGPALEERGGPSGSGPVPRHEVDRLAVRS